MKTITVRLNTHSVQHAKGGLDVGEVERFLGWACVVWNEALSGLVRFKVVTEGLSDVTVYFGDTGRTRGKLGVAAHCARVGRRWEIELSTRRRWYATVQPGWWQSLVGRSVFDYLVHELGHVVLGDWHPAAWLRRWIMHSEVPHLAGDGMRMMQDEVLAYRGLVKPRLEGGLI